MFASVTECMDLKNIINYAINYHDELTRKWFDTHGGQRYNFKRQYVTDINANANGLSEYIFDYLFFLNGETIDFPIKICDCFASNYKISSRTKDISSVEYKIQSYSLRDGGSYPIKKCLNDLFGFRVIHDGCWAFEKIEEFCSKGWSAEKIKCYDATKNGYMATHIYIYYNNYAFPWELQLWNRCDEESNIANHHIYKQEYTKWVENMGGGSII